MRRRTQRFIEAQSAPHRNILSRINPKMVIIAAIVLVVALVLGGAYIWYVRTYGGARKISIYNETRADYEWKVLASDQGITCDYLLSRTENLMIDGGEDGTLIPSWLMIEGRLVTQPQEESGIYDLGDQALLLKIYVRQSDRKSAKSLKKRVMNEIDISAQPLDDQMLWLEAFLEYYSAYGTTSDLHKVEDLTEAIFDENGEIRPVDLTYAEYHQNNLGLGEANEAPYNDEHASLEGRAGEGNESYASMRGVELSAIRLRLIRTLEDNDFLPEGSYERNLEIVRGGLISEDIPLYAYAYNRNADGNIEYIFSYRHAAAISVSEAISSMRNLAEAGQLPDNSFAFIKNLMINDGRILSDYYLVSGKVEGDESVDSYLDIMSIALEKGDRDLYSAACAVEGARVATYDGSPALSMIFRTRNDRYVFYACENLGMILALM